MNQVEKTLQLLRNGFYLTANNSRRTWGITSLRDCIYKLKKCGYPIKTEYLPGNSRAGARGRFGVHSLSEEKQ